MAHSADPKGILEELHRKACTQATLCGCLQEIIADRKWAAGGGDGLQFLFAFFKLRGEHYFLIGSTQYRDTESVRRELTPFASHSAAGPQQQQATLGTSGVGGNLLPIHMNSSFSMLILAEELAAGQPLREDRAAWNLVDWINIEDMNTAIENKDPMFDPGKYRPNTFQLKSQSRYIPFFSEPEFRASPLFQHIQASAYQYFYIFNSTIESTQDSQEYSSMLKYNSELRSQKEFVGLCDALSELYEIPLRDKKLTLITQYGLTAPPVSLEPGKRLLMHPEHSIFTFALDWKFGEKQITDLQREWWASTCRYIPPTSASATPFFSSTSETFYGKVECNGKDKILNGRNSWNQKIARCRKLDEMNWRADIRISIQRLKPDAIAGIPVHERAKLGKGIFVRLEHELLSEEHMGEADIRHLPGGESQYRVIIDILSKKAKENPDSGLSLESYKRHTKIMEKKEIAQCIKLTLNAAKRLLSSVEPMTALNDPATYCSEGFKKKLTLVLDDRERGNEQKKVTKQASRNGHTFEQVLGDILKEKYTELTYNEEDIHMNYDIGDSIIAAREGTEGQACDILGKATITDEQKLVIVIQAKNTKNVDDASRVKFISTVKEYRNKYRGHIVIPLFIQKANKSFSSIVTNHFSEHGIFILTSSAVEGDEQSPYETICDKLKNLISAL